MRRTRRLEHDIESPAGNFQRLLFRIGIGRIERRILIAEQQDGAHADASHG